MMFEICYLITNLGDPQMWSFLSLILLLMYFIIRDNASKRTRKSLKAWLLILIPALALTLLAVFGMKYGFHIERPCIPCSEGLENCNIYCPTGLWEYSFPSGHAAAGFVGFLSLFLVSPVRRHLPILIIPILISLSRIMLGVHTYLDIIAGSVIGIAFPLIFWRIQRK